MNAEIDFSKAHGNPVTKSDQDAFNRAPFCVALANRIAQIGSDDGAVVVGLFGKWGFGKSSMLNLIEEHLEAEHTDTVAVARFNPWRFTNEEQLLQSFYTLLGPMRDPKPGIGKQLKALSHRLGGHLANAADYLAGEPASKVVQALCEPPSLEETNVALRETTVPHTIVVMIDDLDRLDRAEVLLMLKLVRLNGNLPRLVYLLAFDDEIIAKTVGSAYGLDPDAGREFLEKIVQFPFAVPAIGEERLLAYVLQHARAACAKAGINVDHDEWAVYENVCRKGFSARLRTPRQAIRYGAALSFSLPMLAYEVNPVQQMIVEGVRMLYPELYLILRDRTGFALQANDSKALYDAAQTAFPHGIDAVKTILDALLDPALQPKTSAFFHARYWQRYFEYALRHDSISNREVDHLKALSCQPELLAGVCVRLVQRNPHEFSGIVRDLALDRDSTTRLRWIAVLMNASSGLPDAGNRAIWQEWADLIALLIYGSRFDGEAAPLALSDIEEVLMEPCTPGLLPVLWDALKNQDKRLQAQRNHASNAGFGPFDAGTLERLITSRVVAAAPDFLASMFTEDSVGFALFAYLKTYADAPFRTWMASALRNESARSVDIVRHLAKDRLHEALQFQRWVEESELSAILHAHFGETVPHEPRHPRDQIVALRIKYESEFAE